MKLVRMDWIDMTCTRLTHNWRSHSLRQDAAGACSGIWRYTHKAIAELLMGCFSEPCFCSHCSCFFRLKEWSRDAENPEMKTVMCKSVNHVDKVQMPSSMVTT